MKHVSRLRRSYDALHALTIASMKMYFRNYTGVFFTLFIPVILILVFGFLFKENNFTTDIAVTNYSQSELSKQVIAGMEKIDALNVKVVPESEAADLLGRGKVDLQVIIPDTFGAVTPPTSPTEQPSLKAAQVQTYYNESNPGNGQTANLIVGQIVQGVNSAATQTPAVYTVKAVGVKTNNLSPIDFYLPGVIAMSIMQLGIFSVAFVFVTYKTTGQLRRIQATPTRPMYFVVGQGITRLIVAIAQVLLLLGLGILLFQVKMIGNIFAFMAMATLGSAVFLTIGFAIAGWAKDENQATPVAQLIQFPMLFLSGVFFPREGFPSWLQKVTDYLPLTYLVDGLRKIATEGASLWALRGDIIGLVVWGIIVSIIAVRIFRWE